MDIQEEILPIPGPGPNIILRLGIIQKSAEPTVDFQ